MDPEQWREHTKDWKTEADKIRSQNPLLSSLLSRVHAHYAKTDFPGAPTTGTAATTADAEFEVEKVSDMKIESGKLFVFVHWKGDWLPEWALFENFVEEQGKGKQKTLVVTKALKDFLQKNNYNRATSIFRQLQRGVSPDIAVLPTLKHKSLPRSKSSSLSPPSPKAKTAQKTSPKRKTSPKTSPKRVSPLRPSSPPHHGSPLSKSAAMTSAVASVASVASAVTLGETREKRVFQFVQSSDAWSSSSSRAHASVFNEYTKLMTHASIAKLKSIAQVRLNLTQLELCNLAAWWFKFAYDDMLHGLVISRVVADIVNEAFGAPPRSPLELPMRARQALCSADFDPFHTTVLATPHSSFPFVETGRFPSLIDRIQKILPSTQFRTMWYATIHGLSKTLGQYELEQEKGAVAAHAFLQQAERAGKEATFDGALCRRALFAVGAKTELGEIDPLALYRAAGKRGGKSPKSPKKSPKSKSLKSPKSLKTITDARSVGASTSGKGADYERRKAQVEYVAKHVDIRQTSLVDPKTGLRHTFQGAFWNGPHPLSSNTLLGVYEGYILTDEDFQTLMKNKLNLYVLEIRRLGIRVDARERLESWTRFMNDGKEDQAKSRVNAVFSHQGCVYSTADIAVGDEILVSYSSSYWDAEEENTT
jgi:hypothetical protein